MSIRAILHRALLAFSFLSLFGNQPETAATFQAIEWPSMDAVIQWQSPWILAMNTPDPKAAAIFRNYLITLGEQGFPINQQGVWVQKADAIRASVQPQLFRSS